ncbi:nucleolar protein 6, partial [Tanacetum coccineum]
NSKLWGGGIFFEPQRGNNMSNEERKRFAKYFPAVICDLSAHFNIAHRMKKASKRRLLWDLAERYQVKRVSPTDKYLFLRSQHSSMINGLSSRYPLYGPVVQLAKRWVAAHLFLVSFTEEAIKLVVAYIFQKSLPFSAPCSRISGFMRTQLEDILENLSEKPDVATMPMVNSKLALLKVLYETTADRASLLPCQSSSNLLIDIEGNLKLTDFGLARIYSSDHKGNLTNRVISLWYM